MGDRFHPHRAGWITSTLLHSKVDKFTIDSLVAMLFSIGKQVRVAVRSAR